MHHTQVVSTFNAEGYRQYGERFISTFLQYWPQDYHLQLYLEDCPQPVGLDAARVTCLDLPAQVPALQQFKAKWQAIPHARGLINNQYNYAFDAIRFSHKVYAYTHAGLTTKTRYLIWLDADTITHQPIPSAFTSQLLPAPHFVAYLGRPGFHSETGCLAFDCQHQAAALFFQTLVGLYNSGEIFKLLQWNDCVAFDCVRSVFVAQQKIQCVDLAAGLNVMHPFVNTVLGQYMDHLKGPARKAAGRSFQEDFLPQQI